MPASGAGGRWSRPGRTDTRPTADRTRETLFSMLVSRLGSFEGLRVADLYAGSGALGLRGAVARRRARACWSRMTAPRSHAIQANAAKLGAAATIAASRHVGRAAPAPGRRSTSSSPTRPMRTGSGTAVAAAVAEADWLAPGGWLAIETAKRRSGRAPAA